MDSHATSEVAENRVIPRLLTEDADLKLGVWKSLFNDADHFNNILGQAECMQVAG